MNIKGLGIFLVCVFCVAAAPTEAATLYMKPNNAEILRGETIAVEVRLDTEEGECVNVVDATINYPANIEPVDTLRGSSILSIWLEEPVIDKKSQTIKFAGGIPNGYCGRIAGDPRLSNILVELLFRSPSMVVGEIGDSETVTVEFGSETRALLNDGFGTDAPLTTYGTVLNLSDRLANDMQNGWSDRINADVLPPEDFTIQLERNTNAFSNKYYIVFNTTDKQSGMDHYEVMEEPLEEYKFFRWGAEDAPWRQARSPYLLKDQSLNSTIMVKAIDKAGNEYLATLVPEQSQRTMSTQSKVMIAFVLTALTVFFASALVVFVWYRRKKIRHGEMQVEEDEKLGVLEVNEENEQ